MNYSQNTNKYDSGKPGSISDNKLLDIKSDLEYKEELMCKLQGLAEAFNRLKNVINNKGDYEHDK